MYQWNVGSRIVELGKRTLVMAVLNVTPDSFSDGGQFPSAEAAVEAGLQMIADGADILDIGGESTRPGVKVGSDAVVSAEEELRRVLPVVEGLKKARPEILISADTYKAEVARRTVTAGAEIVNDVSGMSWDPQMIGTVAELACGVVVMHSRGTPEDWRDLPAEPRIVQVVQQGLHEATQKAIAAGVHHERIIVDPGFGFGKRLENNYPLLAKLEDLHSIGFPLMVGVSRKSFLAKTAGAKLASELKPLERLHPSIAAAVIAAMKGAHIVRVHDVRPTVEAMAIVDAVMLSSEDMNPWFEAYS
ncbi:Dihydropteroate synthase [Candidatus Koribacter versatilis Ellin345]|uniref:Dihydropteroate synthase n=2 Tax=Candidatus Korobacter versatilis TaxID=658062 RepID=Q1II04_KORVE|nr:Dihydropteroate synthase [Candidatus Koribacter versatilis Ellin345]